MSTCCSGQRGGEECDQKSECLFICFFFFFVFFRLLSLIFSIAGFGFISLIQSPEIFFPFSLPISLPHSLPSFYLLFSFSVTPLSALWDGHRRRKVSKTQSLLFAIVCDGNNTQEKREKSPLFESWSFSCITIIPRSSSKFTEHVFDSWLKCTRHRARHLGNNVRWVSVVLFS